MNPDSQSVYRVEASKVARNSLLLVPENALSSLGHNRDWSLPQSARIQVNFDWIHKPVNRCVQFFRIFQGVS